MSPSDELDGAQVELDGRVVNNIDARAMTIRDASGGDTGACNHAELTFDPRPPTTYLLVDRSSSMFDNKLWEPLKTGVLSVVQQLSSEVRFGFASYTGKNGGTCPDLTQVTIADDNYQTIAAAYQALTAPPYKGETPTAAAINRTADMLASVQSAGPKSIVLVTDGEPDFCDDGNVTCARDSVVAAAQAAFSQDITTYILSIGNGVASAHLRDVANAGTGLPVVDHGGAVANQCPNRVASYASSEGNAPYFEPDVANQSALIQTLSNVVASTRSCIFDLSGRVKIDLEFANEGKVSINGSTIEYGGGNGFRMNSPSELEFLGSACDRIHTPGALRIAVDFPCQALIFI